MANLIRIGAGRSGRTRALDNHDRVAFPRSDPRSDDALQSRVRQHLCAPPAPPQTEPVPLVVTAQPGVTLGPYATSLSTAAAVLGPYATNYAVPGSTTVPTANATATKPPPAAGLLSSAAMNAANHGTSSAITQPMVEPQPTEPPPDVTTPTSVPQLVRQLSNLASPVPSNPTPVSAGSPTAGISRPVPVSQLLLNLSTAEPAALDVHTPDFSRAFAGVEPTTASTAGSSSPAATDPDLPLPAPSSQPSPNPEPVGEVTVDDDGDLDMEAAESFVTPPSSPMSSSPVPPPPPQQQEPAPPPPPPPPPPSSSSTEPSFQTAPSESFPPTPAEPIIAMAPASPAAEPLPQPPTVMEVAPSIAADIPVADGDILDQSEDLPVPGDVQGKDWRTLRRSPVDLLVDEILTFRDWHHTGPKNVKVLVPRILLAKLHDGRWGEIVDFLVDLDGPWGELGSTHPNNKKGDYDFCAIVVAYAVHKLSRVNRAYINDMRSVVNRLLPKKLHEFVTNVPHVPLFTVRETENHILMINTTIYLTALFKSHYDHDKNTKKALGIIGPKLLGELDIIRKGGPWEFNSRPYAAYSLLALLVLEDVAEESMSAKAREVLDFLTYCFALGCSHMRRSDPFRRQPVRKSDTNLYSHPLTSMMLIWLYDWLHCGQPAALRPTPGFASAGQEEELWKAAFEATKAGYSTYAACFRYRPPLETCTLAWGSPTADARYFVVMGHGDESCAEFYYVTSDYILSAGGSSRHHEIVVRDITLMLHGDLEAKDFGALPRMENMLNRGVWNNTGVFMNFAVGRSVQPFFQSVWQLRKTQSIWSLYRPTKANCGNVVLAVGMDSEACVWIVGRYEAAHDDAVLEELVRSKPSLKLVDEVHIPLSLQDNPGCSRVSYDLTLNPKHWIIRTVDGRGCRSHLHNFPLVDVSGRFNGAMKYFQLPP